MIRLNCFRTHNINKKYKSISDGYRNMQRLTGQTFLSEDPIKYSLHRDKKLNIFEKFGRFLKSIFNANK